MNHEPTLVVIQQQRRRGRIPRAGVRSRQRIDVKVTGEERADLKSVAAQEGRTVSDVIRDAVNEYVSDFRERRLFTARQRTNFE